MPDSDHVTWTKEDVRFTKLDPMFSAFRESGSADDDEQGIAIDLQLRPLVGGVCVLNGQIVQSKCMLDVRQYLLTRFVQTNPQESIRVLPSVAKICNRYISHADAMMVRS